MQSNIFISSECINKHQNKKHDQKKLFQKYCGRYCYEKYHPVDNKKVLEIAYQYHIINPHSDHEDNYYKALLLLRSQSICKNKVKCCNYWNCKCVRQRFSKYSS